MAKIKIEGLPHKFTLYEDVEGYDYVIPLLIQEFEWFDQVINQYPQSELLRYYWESVILKFIDYISMYHHIEKISIEHHHRLASPRINSVDWLIKRINGIGSARKAFERYIKPDTATGQELLNSFNKWRSMDIIDGIDPLERNGEVVRFNRKGLIIEKEAKDGE